MNRRYCRSSIERLALAGVLAGTLATVSPAHAAPSVAHAWSAAADPAACPLQPSSTTPSGEAWAFTESAPPATPHTGITSSYSHGRGTWARGHGVGTICTEDSVSGRASHNLVLTLAGAARISPHVTRLGHLGVGLVLDVKVAASDDQSCTAGERGTVTLFASYYQGHDDSVQLQLEGDCSSYRYTYSGSQVRVLIADNGRQVN